MSFTAPAPRGLAGRPLFAILFAIVLGILAFYLNDSLHLGGVVAILIVAAIACVVHFGWLWLERPR